MKSRRNTFDFKIAPKKELAYFIGATMGDGYLSPNRVVIFGVKDKDFMDEFVRSSKRIIKFANPEQPKISNDNSLVIICCTDFYKWFYKESEDKVKIPSFIMNGTKPIKINFLNGFLDADGGITKCGRYIQLFQKNLIRLNMVYDLCKNLNIKTSKIGSLFNKKNNKSYGYFYIYTKQFKKLGGKFSIKRKQERLNIKIKTKKRQKRV